MHLRNSKKYSREIIHELNYELLERTQAASPGFFMASAWVMHGQLQTVRFKNEIFILGLLLLITSSLRYVVIRMFFENKLNFDRSVLYAKINVVVNGLLWALVVLIPIYEFKFTNSIADLGVIGIILGFVLSSVVTLAFHLLYAYFFQWAVAVPSMMYLYYLAHFEKNESALNAAVILTIALLYLFNQTRNVHNQIVKRISYGLDLEKTNQLLQKSQSDLIDEKAKLQHSIRLAAVGEISGEIAHEINNPLGLILGYLELSLEELKKTNPDKNVLEAKLLKARSAISRITKIIRGLRHYSKNTVDEPMQIVYLNEIIDDAVDFCSEKINYHRADLKIISSIDFKIECRTIEISQVLLNIFTNAIDEVSRLDIGKRTIILQTEKMEDKWVKIMISNEGPQIDPKIQDKLFQPFFSTKKMGIGTGLGLSISRNIIENHKGRLYYDPSFPLTTFVIELPIA